MKNFRLIILLLFLGYLVSLTCSLTIKSKRESIEGVVLSVGGDNTITIFDGDSNVKKTIRSGRQDLPTSSGNVAFDDFSSGSNIDDSIYY